MATKFQSKVYAVCCKIPKGKVSTYKDIATRINCKSYRAIGQALTRNPFSPRVPCHRVVCSNGKLGGFAHGSNAKIRVLRNEGILIEKGRIMNFDKVLFKFNS